MASSEHESGFGTRQQQQAYTQQSRHEESVREIEHVQHANQVLKEHQDSLRAQTEASAVRIVTPHYKTAEKPGTDFKIGSSAEELNAKFAEAHGDYKAERSSEHFRMQIIDPKVVDHAHMPAHPPRDYARKRLIEDFPSLHSHKKEDLDKLDQWRIRKPAKITADLGRFKLPDSKRDWDKVPWPTDDSNLRELDRLRQSIDQLQKVSREQPRREPRALVRPEPLPPLPVRREIVERRVVREVAQPKTTHTVHRVEEHKRTEDVERRIVRRERRHKSHRTRRSGAGHQEQYYDYSSGGGGGGGGQWRSSSASRFQPIAYEDGHWSTNGRRGGDYSSAASDRFYQGGGSLSDSLRRGDAKYAPNGEVRGGNTIANREYSRKMHKSYSTRDVYGGGGGGYGASYRGAEPLVEFPPTLPRGQWAPPPPPHHGGGGGGTIVKSRSYADWDESRNGPRYKHGEDMARLETELRDAHLMRLPNGNMHEKEHHHQEIPGGYELYDREVKSHTGRRLNREGAPADYQKASQEYNYKRETQR